VTGLCVEQWCGEERERERGCRCEIGRFKTSLALVSFPCRESSTAFDSAKCQAPKPPHRPELGRERGQTPLTSNEQPQQSSSAHPACSPPSCPPSTVYCCTLAAVLARISGTRAGPHRIAGLSMPETKRPKYPAPCPQHHAGQLRDIQPSPSLTPASPSKPLLKPATAHPQAESILSAPL
jgi:hypothetical protein